MVFGPSLDTRIPVSISAKTSPRAAGASLMVMVMGLSEPSSWMKISVEAGLMLQFGRFFFKSSARVIRSTGLHISFLSVESLRTPTILNVRGGWVSGFIIQDLISLVYLRCEVDKGESERVGVEYV